jgi:hypothetical protein
MNIVFLVPRRADGGARDRLWALCRDRWERYFPEIRVVEGHHDEGPFSRAAAVNRAAEAAGDWDLGIVIDADVMLGVSQVRAAIDRAATTGRVTWAHRRWRGVSEAWTDRIVRDARDFGPELDRDEIDLLVERTNPLSWSCCFVVPRAVWDDAGGFDERFRGWGFEDMAWQSLIVGLYGHERIEGDVVHLWHPRSEERIQPGLGRGTASPEYVTNARLGRRYMLALRRDHSRHDRGDVSVSEEERQRDIANLRADDAKYSPVVRQLRLPDWDDWWPTLEELRDGAKAARAGTEAPTITLIVHSGGEEAAWTERSAYLRTSLASLSAKVTGPIVQRVLYSDWAGHRGELEAIAGEHGFYVAGQGHHGYTAGMSRMWDYLSRRARGEYVFQAEDDFLFHEPIDLADLVEVLRGQPKLAQVALLRAPAYESEREKGGILGWPTESFEPVQVAGYTVLAHRNFWTQNPSLFRRAITSRPWPNAASSERVFGDQLFRDPTIRTALWGNGQAQIEHIGAMRAGAAY